MTRRALAGAIVALLIAAGFAVPGQRRDVELIPPQAATRAVPLSERIDDSPVADYRATSTTRQPRAERRTVRLLAPAPRPEPSADAVLWRIAECESGKPPNYRAVNRSSGAGGAFQYLASTWNNWGGYSRAELAPPDIQWQRARYDYARVGTRPWAASRACWGRS